MKTKYCSQCGERIKVRTSPFRNPKSLPKHNRNPRSLKDHDLCRRCFRSIMQRNLAQQQHQQGSFAERALCILTT